MNGIDIEGFIVAIVLAMGGVMVGFLLGFFTGAGMDEQERKEEDESGNQIQDESRRG